MARPQKLRAEMAHREAGHTVIVRAPKAAGYRRHKQNIRRILPAAVRKECLHAAINAVKTIARAAPRELPGNVKLQLAALRRARAALMRLIRQSDSSTS